MRRPRSRAWYAAVVVVFFALSEQLNALLKLLGLRRLFDWLVVLGLRNTLEVALCFVGVWVAHRFGFARGARELGLRVWRWRPKMSRSRGKTPRIAAPPSGRRWEPPGRKRLCAMRCGSSPVPLRQGPATRNIIRAPGRRCGRHGCIRAVRVAVHVGGQSELAREDDARASWVVQQDRRTVAAVVGLAAVRVPRAVAATRAVIRA